MLVYFAETGRRKTRESADFFECPKLGPFARIRVIRRLFPDMIGKNGAKQ
jgi:hypothetical protein